MSSSSIRTRNVAWPIQVTPGLLWSAAGIEIDARSGTAAPPERDPQPAGEEGQRDGEAGAQRGVLLVRHRPGVAAIFSSTVVPSFSGVGSAKATFTDSTRVSVGRPGSCGLSGAGSRTPAISSTAPVPGPAREAVGADLHCRAQGEGGGVGLVRFGLDAQPGQVGHGDDAAADLDASRPAWTWRAVTCPRSAPRSASCAAARSCGRPRRAWCRRRARAISRSRCAWSRSWAASTFSARQVLAAVQRQLGQPDLRLRLQHLGLRLAQGGAQLVGFELGQQLALADDAPLVHEHAHDAARALRAHASPPPPG